MKVQVISCTPSVREENICDLAGVTVHFVPSARRFGNITFGAADRLRIQRHIRALSPDLIHNQYHFAYPYIFSKPPIPAITTVHGITFREAPYESETLDWLRKLPRLWLERMVLRNVDHAICVSEYVRETIAPLTTAKLVVIENPVSRKYFDAANREIPNRLLFAGAIIKRKNILSLLKAITLLSPQVDVTLHIVGVAEERYYYELLREYVRQNRLERRVIFRGVVSDDELVREYEECSMVVLPSYEESAGMVLQQAMAAGKPVVATRIGGIPGIVIDKVTGRLTQVGNVQELADSVRMLLESEELRRSMGAAGREQAVRRFRPDVIASATYDTYRIVLGSGRVG